jgi:hypothetical protein
MELYQNQLILSVPNFGLRIEVSGYCTGDMIRALKPHLTDSSILAVLMSDENYEFLTKTRLSHNAIYILDCVGQTWVREHKISAIKLIRKVFNCDLREAKNAVEEYAA